MIRAVSWNEFTTDEFALRWRDLVNNTTPHDLGQTYGWNRAWWETYAERGSGVKQWLLLADESNGVITAIWPMFIRHRHGLRVLHWVGQVEGMITDYMLPVVSTDNRASATRTFIEYLAEHSADWDVVNLTIPSWSGLFPVFAKTLVLHGSRLQLAWEGGVSDYSAAVDLPPTFDLFLSSLGSQTRKSLRRYLRAADAAGAQFETTSDDRIQARLPDLFRLNGLRWTVFNSEIARRFLDNVVQRTASDNHSALLVSLRLSGETIATALCYRQGGVCYYHAAGVQRETVADFGPGITMLGLLTKHLIEDGVTRLDFSPGVEEYKLRLGASVETMFRLTVWRRQTALHHLKAINLALDAKQLLLNRSFPFFGRRRRTSEGEKHFG